MRINQQELQAALQAQRHLLDAAKAGEQQ
jgi:hypothetical protein